MNKKLLQDFQKAQREARLTPDQASINKVSAIKDSYVKRDDLLVFKQEVINILSDLNRKVENVNSSSTNAVNESKFQLTQSINKVKSSIQASIDKKLSEIESELESSSTALESLKNAKVDTIDELMKKINFPVQKSVNIPVPIDQGGTGVTTLAAAQALFGGGAIGDPVAGAGADLILYVDSSGNLAQHPNLSFGAGGTSFVIGGDSLDVTSIFAGVTEIYDADGNVVMGVGNTYSGVTINPGFTTSENLTINGSGASDPVLMAVYPFGNTVNFGAFSDLGGTVGMQAVATTDDTCIIRAIAAQTGYLLAFEASDGTQKFGINPGGDLNFGTASAGVSMIGTSGGPLTIDGYGGASAQVRINGSFGFNVTPVAQSTGWSITNVSSDKTFDASAADLAETRNVLGTLLNQLLSYGFIAA